MPLADDSRLAGVPLSVRLISFIAYLYLTLVWFTTRLRVYGKEHHSALRRANQRFIYAFWHNRQVFYTCTHRDDRAAILVSRSKDGEIIARVMEHSRIRASRGSSSRGASAALREMMGLIGEGFDIGFTPDGPKGPVCEVKPGALFMAQKLGIPILPTSNSLSRKLVLKKSWDQFQFPLPFGRAVLRYAAPITVGPQDDLKVKALELKKAMDRITAEAEAETGPTEVHKTPQPSLNWVPLLLTNALAPAAAAGVALHFALSGRRGVLKRLPEEFKNRCGLLSNEDLSMLSGRPVLWIHAASAGEVGATRALIERLKDFPVRPAVLMTTMTSAGRDAARSLQGVDAAAVAPLDSLPTMTAFLKAARPYALILVETELWPNMIELSRRRGLRIGLANGRMSAKSFSRYRLIKLLFGPLLKRIELLAVQTTEDARRFMKLGVAPITLAVTGNMKHDRIVEPSGHQAVAERLRSLGWEGKPLFVAGSTHPEEEEILIAAFASALRSLPSARLVLAPRHVERASAADETLRRHGLATAFWSRHDESTHGSAQVLLLDAMGHLPGFYTQAVCSFVGGTFVPLGGHNLLEPALAASPVLFGPHTEHVEETAGALLESGGGLRVTGAADLAMSLRGWLGDTIAAKKAGQAARRAALDLRGATERTFAHLRSILEPPDLPGSPGF